MRSAFFLIPSLAAFVFLASCGGGSYTPPTPIVVAVTPASATVSPGATKQFMASVTGTTNTSVTWQVNSVTGGNATVGTISATGLYTAPNSIPNPSTVTVAAVSSANPADSGSATVTVGQQVSMTVAVTPNPTSVAIFATQQFTAAVNGVASTAVTWQVNGVTGGTQATGFISTSGLFVAPGSVPTTSTGSGGVTTTPVTVTAVSTANPSDSGSATVTITAPNQNLQSGPIQFGTSGSNRNDSSTSGNTITCCSGTLGSLVTRGGTQYILSNNHVLARTDLGVIGEAIIQPGLVDTRCGQGAFSTVGQLSQFYNLETGTAPKIDAAIAQATTGAVDPSGNILFLGATTDANNVPLPGAPHAGSGVAASVNMAVTKSGRSTGLTCSTVLSTNTPTTVQYQK